MRMTPRKLEQLRMLADWQLRQLGYDPMEITRLCREVDDAFERILNSSCTSQGGNDG